MGKKQAVTQETTRVSKTEKFGQWSEAIARAMGTPAFLVVLTLFCTLWLLWNTLAPEHLRFDSATIGFTALTLILSLQASYAAPMILLAQNRQDDRDRVHIAQDRQRAERNLADTEFLAREVVALRLALKDLPDRDWLRQELKTLLAELEPTQAAADTLEANPEVDTSITEATTGAFIATAAEKPVALDAPRADNTAESTQTQISEIGTNPVTGRLDII